jgi:hypothetical protein
MSSTPALSLSTTVVSDLLKVTGGSIYFIIGVKDLAGRGHRIGMHVMDGGAAPTDTLVGLTCDPSVKNTKRLIGRNLTTMNAVDMVMFANWSLLPQWMINWLGLVNTPDPNFMTLHRSATPRSDMIVLLDNNLELFSVIGGLWNLLAGKTVIFSWIGDDMLNHPNYIDPYKTKNNIPDTSTNISVTCVTQQNGVIVGLGGPCPAPNNSKQWSLSTDHVMNLMVNGRVKFVLPSPGGPVTIQKCFPFVGCVPLTVTPSEEVVIDLGPWPNLRPFLKAKSDGNVPTKLLQLPTCPP